jgi:hypothetical protein
MEQTFNIPISESEVYAFDYQHALDLALFFIGLDLVDDIDIGYWRKRWGV